MDGLAFQVEDDALDAHGKADAGGRVPAYLLYQAIVAAAAAEGVLSAFGHGLDFEDGARVVVEATDESVVEGEGNAHALQEAYEVGEVGLAVGAEVVAAAGSVLDEGLARGILAIEESEGGAVESGGAVAAEAFDVAAVIGLQGLHVGRSAGRVTDAVQLKGEVLQTELHKDLPAEAEDLGVNGGVGVTYGLDIELVELAEPAGLGPGVAEHGGHNGVEADGLGPSVEAVLEVGAAYGGGGLGAEGEGVAARAVGDEVHLLLDDVSDFTDAAHEEVVVLENRGVYLAVGVALADGDHGVADAAPAGLGVGEDVFGAADGAVAGLPGQGRSPMGRGEG